VIVITGLVILVAAVVVGVAGVLSNGGSGHALTELSRDVIRGTVRIGGGK
jgi:hypothetical protein